MRTRQSVASVPITRLTAHPSNIREDVGDVSELAQSVREHGLIEPIVATEHPTVPEQLLVLAGHRRLAACLLAGFAHVPVIIRHDLGADEVEHLLLMLVENCQRRDLTPVEKAEAFGALRHRGLSLAQISRRVGLSVPTISYYLSLLDLDEASLEAVRAGEVPSTVAVEAVRAARRTERTRSGQPRRGRPVVTQAAHFTGRHRLAAPARDLCEHTDAPSVGNVACGACWEAVIRADALGTLVFTDPAIDEAAVVRAVDGDKSVTLTPKERREAIRRLHGRRLSDGQIAEVLGCSSKTVERARAALELAANCGPSGRVA